MSKFIEELKRRNVIKAAIAYVVVAWVILQVRPEMVTEKPLADQPEA